MKILLIIISISILYEAHALRCYVCEGQQCEDLNDKLEYCGPETTTSTSTSTTDDPSTDPLTDPTTDSTTTEETSTESSFTAVTSSPTGETTSTATSSETPSITSETTSDSSTSTSSVNTTPPTTESSTITESSSSPITVTSSESEPSTNIAFELNEIFEDQEESNEEKTRQFKSKSLDTFLRLKRDVEYSSYACYQAYFNGTQKRGCVIIPFNESGCKALAAEYNETEITDCAVCAMDKCNSGTMQHTNIFLLPLSLLIFFSLGYYL